MPQKQPLATARMPTLSDLVRTKQAAHSSRTAEEDIITAMSYINFLNEKGYFRGERIGRLNSCMHGVGIGGSAIFYHPGQIVIFTNDDESLQPEEVIIEMPLTRQELSRGVDNHTLAGVPRSFVNEIDVSQYARN